MVDVDPVVWDRGWQKQTFAARFIWNRENCNCNYKSKNNIIKWVNDLITTLKYIDIS